MTKAPELNFMRCCFPRNLHLNDLYNSAIQDTDISSQIYMQTKSFALDFCGWHHCKNATQNKHAFAIVRTSNERNQTPTRYPREYCAIKVVRIYQRFTMWLIHRVTCLYIVRLRGPNQESLLKCKRRLPIHAFVCQNQAIAHISILIRISESGQRYGRTLKLHQVRNHLQWNCRQTTSYSRRALLLIVNHCQECRDRSTHVTTNRKIFRFCATDVSKAVRKKSATDNCRIRRFLLVLFYPQNHLQLPNFFRHASRTADGEPQDAWRRSNLILMTPSKQSFATPPSCTTTTVNLLRGAAADAADNVAAPQVEHEELSIRLPVKGASLSVVARHARVFVGCLRTNDAYDDARFQRIGLVNATTV